MVKENLSKKVKAFVHRNSLSLTAYRELEAGGRLRKSSDRRSRLPTRARFCLCHRLPRESPVAALSSRGLRLGSPSRASTTGRNCRIPAQIYLRRRLPESPTGRGYVAPSPPPPPSPPRASPTSCDCWSRAQIYLRRRRRLPERPTGLGFANPSSDLPSPPLEPHQQSQLPDPEARSTSVGVP